MSIFSTASILAAPITRISAVPFTSQAPLGNWAEPYQDFCEEANVVMAVPYVKNLPLDARTANVK